jgi:hypothetical protein
MLTGKTISELPLLEVLDDNMVGPVELSGVTYHINYSQILSKPHGSWTSNVNQVVSGSNIPTLVTVDSPDIEVGVTVVDNSKFTVSQDGTYLFGISFQLDKNTLVPANSTVYFWARVDGVNLPGSAGELIMLNNNNESFPFIPYAIPLTSGQYVEFVFASSDSTVYLKFVESITSPYERPTTPSVIIICNLIS